MAVIIKNQKQIELMREAGRILAIVHEELKEFIRPGISTLDIDRKGKAIIDRFGCIPSFLNYEVVHGIPKKKRILKEGDIVSLDAGVIYKGYHSDAARTWPVGTVSKETQKLLDVTKQSFYEGIKFAKAGRHLHEISRAIQKYVESNGFSVVRDLVGHGVGADLHEDPQVPNFKPIGRGILLQPGMTLAIEPMVNAGKKDVWWLDDDWTVVTKDGSKSAHYENTILITEGEPEILSIQK